MNSPVEPSGLLDRAALKVDSAILSLVHRLPSQGPERLSDRMVRDVGLSESSTHRRCFEDPDWLYPPPAEVKMRKRWMLLHRVGWQEWSWKSEHPMAFPEIEADYRADRRNSRAVMRTLDLCMKGRPMAIVINGFSSGHHIVERMAWPIREFRRHGVGVALFALPFHGPRSSTFPPAWPGDDHRHVIEGFRQAIWDIRVAMRALREAGASHVGAVGMSLGGLTTSLLATAADDLDFAIPYVPLDSIPEFMKNNGLYQGDSVAENDALHTLNTELLAPVTPTRRAPAISPERMHVISGTFDQFAPVQHGKAIADHFGSNLITFDGAHLLQRRRAAAFKQAFDTLRRDAII